MLDKLFELCPFMHLIVTPHENHTDDLFLTHTQFQEIVNFDIVFFPIRIVPTFGAILIPSLYHIEKMIDY